MTNLTLKQLRYFEALARHGHFGRAAAASAISQPALSMQIREMEAELGAALFERTARKVRLTAFGEGFARRVRPVLEAFEALDAYAATSRDGALTRLRLGLIPTIAPYLLPDLIACLSAAHPGIDLHVRETLTHRLIEELRDGKLDAAIAALPVSEPAFDEVPLTDEPFVLVRPLSAAETPPPPVDALRRERLLLLEEGHCFRNQALAFCDLRSGAARDSLDGSSLSTLVQMVGAGLGVTLVPMMAVPVETAAASVTLTRFAAPEPGRTIGMIWRRGSPLAEQLGDIAQLVRQTAQSLIEKAAR